MSELKNKDLNKLITDDVSSFMKNKDLRIKKKKTNSKLKLTTPPQITNVGSESISLTIHF